MGTRLRWPFLTSSTSIPATRDVPWPGSRVLALMQQRSDVDVGQRNLLLGPSGFLVDRVIGTNF